MLRNKKTGKIGDLLGTYDAVPFIGIAVDYHDGNPIKYEYDSIAKLNEEWEDYKPKEPLLKGYPNEMGAIRAYGWSPLTFHRHARKGYSTFNFCTDYICFNRLFENLKDGETYNITELCGEEGE